jgi:hypothetical protein
MSQLIIIPILLTVFIGTLINPTTGFSASVPPLRSVCMNQLPHHDTYKPQTSEPPFKITTSGTEVMAGESVLVTLSSTTPITFKGFYLQAKDENSKPIGSFSPDMIDSKAHSCGGVRNNAAHHANGKIEKTRVTITWTSPKDYSGEVTFISTFVQHYVHIWAGVYSDPVLVTPFVKRSSDSGNSAGGILDLVSSLGIQIPGITSKTKK